MKLNNFLPLNKDLMKSVEPLESDDPKELNYRFDPQSFTFKAFDEEGEAVERSFMEKIQDNKSPLIQGSLSLTNAFLNNQETQRNDRDREGVIQNIYGTTPIWDYNEMYGDNTSGGSQFQPIIKAEKGAKVRTMLEASAPINVEKGEFIILPDGTTELIRGKKHKDGGVNTILPEGSIIYSNKLKPMGDTKTFAQKAKDLDFNKYLEILKNPFSDPATINTATKMIDRNKKKLATLFQDQQMMNGDSSGEPMMKNGGYTKYEDGGTFDFVRNQSPNPTTNFEKRMYNNTNKIQNKDGSQSTHKMMSWSDDNGFYAAPTIVEKNGKLIQLSEDEAQEYAYKTGELKQFKTDKEAQEYARNGYKKVTPMEIFSPNEEYRGFEDGGINIKPENKGKFTEWAKSKGMGVQEAASKVMSNKEDYSSTIVKRANFAKNAASWGHEKGGYIEYEKGGMIKRADGSYSKRGLWDNIRDNKGSGKEPTAEMLKQERKIKNKMEYGGKIKTIMENGGIVEGQELELTKEEIKFLKKQGFKFDIL